MAALPLTAGLWSDWGTPERVLKSLEGTRLGPAWIAERAAAANDEAR
jgi:hypothetical protein